MNLTEHFTLDALLRSDTAEYWEFHEQYSPPAAVIDNLKILCVKVLEPLRVKAGAAVFISSGYRCQRLNTAVGGEPSSQHLSGEAADTNAEGFSTDQWYGFIKTAGIPFDELIIETDGHGDWWVHVSYDPSKKVQGGICMKGVLQPGGGTLCEQDGFGSFKNAA
jgi:hypothetical protein